LLYPLSYRDKERGALMRESNSFLRALV